MPRRRREQQQRPPSREIKPRDDTPRVADVVVTSESPLTFEVKFRVGAVVASGEHDAVARDRAGRLTHSGQGGCGGLVERVSRRGFASKPGWVAHYFRCTRCVSVTTRDYYRFSVLTAPGQTLPARLRRRGDSSG